LPNSDGFVANQVDYIANLSNSEDGSWAESASMSECGLADEEEDDEDDEEEDDAALNSAQDEECKDEVEGDDDEGCNDSA
jgi:hypothetical protein